MIDNNTETTEEDRNKPLPIDIKALLVKIKAYELYLKQALKDKMRPELPTEDKRFTDCILAMLNERARKNAGPELNGRYFEDTRDLLRHLHQTQLNSSFDDEPTQWRALAPKIGLGHTVGYAVRASEGRNAVVAFEPATETIAKDRFEELINNAKDFPDAIDKAAMLVSGIQKSRSGCPSFGISTLMTTSIAPEGIDELFETLLDDDSPQYSLIKDSYGNIHHYSDYVNAQSQTQIRGVGDNPKWWGRMNIEEDPVTRDGRSLLKNNLDNRIAEELTELETGRSEILQFSNAIDVERVQWIDWLVNDLEELQRQYPETAGQIFADRLAEVWASRQPGWDRTLHTARSAVDHWDTTNDKVWQEDHPCWKQPVEARVQAITEMLDAIPQWQSSPTLRINVLGRIVQEVERIRLEMPSDRLDSALQGALKSVPEAIKQLAPGIWEKEELDHLLALNAELLQTVSREKRVDGLKDLAGVIGQLSNDSLQQELVAHLIKQIAPVYKAEGYQADYMGVLLACAGELAQSTSDKKQRLNQVGPLINPTMNVLDRQLQQQVRSIIELAVNLDENDFDRLQKWNAGEDAGELTDDLDGESLTNMVEVAEQLQNNGENSGWSSYASLQKDFLQSDSIWDAFSDEVDEVAYVRVDKDVEHPLQRLAEMRRERMKLLAYLPEDKRDAWKDEQFLLDKLLDEAKRRIIQERQRGNGPTPTETLPMEAEWAHHAEQHEALSAVVGNEMRVRLEDHEKYLDSALRNLTSIEHDWEEWLVENRGNTLEPPWDELDEAVGKIVAFRSELSESKERLAEGKNPIARDAKRITSDIRESRTTVEALLEEVRVLDLEFRQSPEQIREPSPPPVTVDRPTNKLVDVTEDAPEQYDQADAIIEVQRALDVTASILEKTKAYAIPQEIDPNRTTPGTTAQAAIKAAEYRSEEILKLLNEPTREEKAPVAKQGEAAAAVPAMASRLLSINDHAKLAGLPYQLPDRMASLGDTVGRPVRPLESGDFVYELRNIEQKRMQGKAALATVIVPRNVAIAHNSTLAIIHAQIESTNKPVSGFTISKDLLNRAAALEANQSIARPSSRSSSEKKNSSGR